MSVEGQKIVLGEKDRSMSDTSLSKEEAGIVEVHFDKAAERAYGKSCSPDHDNTSADFETVRKLDFYLLPFLSIMYFFNAVDRSNLGNAKTDGMDIDLGFTGEQYSLLILLFYVPNGLCDLPLNMLTKKWSGRVMLPSRKSLPVSTWYS
tara:strand:- start:3124 stop:3570 length:447 start_codon:yes stop_codon:yes gene_type:complete